VDIRLRRRKIRRNLGFHTLCGVTLNACPKRELHS